MVNEQIVKTASALFECDAVDNSCSTYLCDISLCLKNISGINCENWSLLKLATALKVIFCPVEEEGDNYHEVLSKDEQLKLKAEAPKYYGILSEAKCLRTYQKIWSAHRVRIQKKILLESLIKKAKEACEAEQAQACEKGKVHRESEQIPQQRLMFANLCRMILPVISASRPPSVNALPLPKGLKRSWDSAFEPSLPFVKAYHMVRLGTEGMQEFLEPSLQLPKPLCHISPFLLLCC
ncbi:unnamed protein product [Urochloa humidicola]